MGFKKRQCGYLAGCVVARLGSPHDTRWGSIHRTPGKDKDAVVCLGGEHRREACLEELSVSCPCHCHWSNLICENAMQCIGNAMAMIMTMC